MSKYTINDLALMTGFTTRTLRTYMKKGLLNGTMTDRTWYFTEEEFSAFTSDRNVMPGLISKQNAIIFDYLTETDGKEDTSCTILDIREGEHSVLEISTFFCEKINEALKNEEITFSLLSHKDSLRVVMRGSARTIAAITAEYQKWQESGRRDQS